MLKFFRSIRHRLLNSGKVQNYLLYALGEIILVVIGILIALQVNNWNEGNKQELKVNSFLFNLKKDLQHDEENMEKLKKSNIFRFYSMQYLLQMANEKSYDPTLDGITIPKWEKGNRIWHPEIPEKYDSTFIHLAFLWTHRIGDSYINLNTIEELKSTGMFSQIANPELKAAINRYYELCEFRIFRSVSLNSEDVRIWQNSLLKDGVINSDPFIVENPLALIKNHSERAGIIRQLMRNAAWFTESAEVVSQAAEELIELIEKEVPDQKK